MVYFTRKRVAPFVLVFCFLDNYIIPFLTNCVNPFFYVQSKKVVKYDESCRGEDSPRRPIEISHKVFI